MNESIIIVTADEAIDRLIQHKQMYGNHVSVCIVDLTNGAEKKERKTIEEGCSIISKSGTLLINEDDYVPHLMAFNTQKRTCFSEMEKYMIFYYLVKSKKRNKQMFDNVLTERMFVIIMRITGNKKRLLRIVANGVGAPHET